MDFDPAYVQEDVREAVSTAHSGSAIHRAVLKNPETYFVRQPEMRLWLEKLRRADKKIFLLSNSPVSGLLLCPLSFYFRGVYVDCISLFFSHFVLSGKFCHLAYESRHCKFAHHVRSALIIYIHLIINLLILRSIYPSDYMTIY